MKTIVEIITYFVFLYPLVAAIIWTITGLIHYYRKEEIAEFEEQIEFTILVPIYNEESNIREHLEHNLKLDYDKFKIIAIDDKSTDNSVAEIKQISDSKLEFYQNPENYGKAKTLNIMVDEITTDYFLVIDSDTKLEPDSLKKINNRIHQDIEDENQDEIAAYTGNITVHTDEKNKVFRMQKIEYRAFIDMIKRSQFTLFKSIMTLSGACSIYNTKAFREVGKFSEVNATEDINISWRLNLAGYRLVYIDDLYASVTTPENVFDLVQQRKRWTNGLLQTMIKYKSDLIKPQNLDLKLYTLEIFISSLWALSFMFVNLYYIMILFTNYYEDLLMVRMLFPTLIILFFSTILAITSYAISDNDRETKRELVKYYLLFPFAYFYVQPIGYILGFIETIKRNTNHRWRRKLSNHSRVVFATIIDIVINVVLLQLILEVFTDYGFIFDAYWKFLLFLIIYIGIIIFYYYKLFLGERSIAIRLGMFRNPSFYIIMMFLVARFIKATAVFSGIIKFENVYKLDMLIFILLIVGGMVIFEVVYQGEKRTKRLSVNNDVV